MNNAKLGSVIRYAGYGIQGFAVLVLLCFYLFIPEAVSFGVEFDGWQRTAAYAAILSIFAGGIVVLGGGVVRMLPKSEKQLRDEWQDQQEPSARR